MNKGFQYYPEKLYKSAVIAKQNEGIAVRMTNIPAHKFFDASKPKEIYYSIKDGNWLDPTIWETVGGSTGKTPSLITDDVYVRHNVGVNLSALGTIQINNLFINTDARLNAAGVAGGRNLMITGNLKCLGTIDLNSGGSLGIILWLSGFDNYIQRDKVASIYDVHYIANGDQAIMPLDYGALFTGGTMPVGSATTGGIKYLTGDTTCTSFTWQAELRTTVFETLSWNFICYGTSAWGFLSAKGNGTLRFDGLATIFSNWNFSTASPTIDMRGGVTISGSITTGTTALWNFTTNNQNITVNNAAGAMFDCVVTNGAGLTLTNISAAGFVQVNNTFDNLSAGSSIINKGGWRWNNASFFDITVGTFDKDNFNTNIVGYIFNGSVTLPYTTYQGLLIRGTGTKTAAGNTTISTTLTVDTSGTFDAAAHNLTVTGATTIAGSGTGALLKSGAGSILFTGLLSCSVGGGGTLNFSGNPTIEMRGGMSLGGNTSFFETGTGTWTFTTNNQTVTLTFNANTNNTPNTILPMKGAVVISGAISVTLSSSSTRTWQMNVSIDGDNVSSTFINQASFYLNTTTAPMLTGVFTRSASTNIIGYVMTGDFTIPYTDYQGLYIGNVTGVKTLSGNTTVATTLAVVTGSVSAGLELSTYDFTVTGTQNIQGMLSKNGTGNVLFIGAYQMSSIPSALVFSGNPNVEIRGGMSFFVTMGNSGTGTWTFSTNNQTLAAGSNITVTFSGNVVVSGAITVTITGTSSNVFFIGSLDGNNAASTVDNRLPSSSTGSVQYQNATAPMATGVLTCNAAANTWKYNKAGAQDVQGGTTHLTGGQYRTLEFGGSGAKRLLGNVDWTTAFSQTGSASTDLNGFTLS